MLTLRFDVPDAAAASVSDLLRQRILPQLIDRHGIVGVHLCRADVAGSRIETAEKKMRSRETQVPRWIILVEGISAAHLQAGSDLISAALTGHNPAASDCVQTVYQLEFQRCKLPWGACG